MNAPFTRIQQSVFDRTLALVKTIAGVKAVVLGGSFADGRATSHSDIDLALYYDETAPFSTADLQTVIDQLNDTADAVATPLYGWGKWINGGAWLTIQGQRLDFLYRNIQQVEQVIEACQRGEFVAEYYHQVAHGFFSYIYLAETEICQPVYDPDGIIAHLKSRTRPYPPALKSALYNNFKFHAEFTLPQYEKAVKRGDVFMAAGCVTRISSALVQILFALNERYYLSDKGALATIDTFALKPPDFRERLEAGLQNLMTSVDLLSLLIAETVALDDRSNHG